LRRAIALATKPALSAGASPHALALVDRVPPGASMLPGGRNVPTDGASLVRAALGDSVPTALTCVPNKQRPPQREAWNGRCSPDTSNRNEGSLAGQYLPRKPPSFFDRSAARFVISSRVALASAAYQAGLPFVGPSTWGLYQVRQARTA
jgi:hypothetical protein